MGKIPEGWLPYAPIGNQVPGTRFIAFKVPLREAFVDKLQADDRFTINVLLDRIPDLGLVIDLTHTTKYYNKREFLDRGVDYVKIQTPGQIVPPQHLVERFFEVVDYYLDSHKNDNSLIGVHCTHGVNRTGYMLCRYLIQRLGYTFNEAVEAVGGSRGHTIERTAYIKSLDIHKERVDKKIPLKSIIESAKDRNKQEFSQIKAKLGLMIFDNLETNVALKPKMTSPKPLTEFNNDPSKDIGNISSIPSDEPVAEIQAPNPKPKNAKSKVRKRRRYRKGMVASKSVN